MASDEILKVKLDISDVIIKRAAEIKEAEKAEKAKIAALKRESAAQAKEDKEAFDFAVALAKKEAAEKEKIAKRLSTLRENEFAVRMETATAAVQDQRVHIDALRGRMNLLGEGLGKAGSAAAALGPEFGGLAQGMQKAGGAASALLASVSAFGGPAGVALGVALAAATAAWGAHAEKVAENENALKSAKEEAEKTAGVFNQLADDLFEATLQQKVLNKELTQAEADIQRAAHGINEAYGPALEELTERIDAAKVARTKAYADEEKAILSNARTMEAAGEQGRQNIDAERKAREDADRELDTAYEAYDRLQASMNNLGTVQTDVIVKTGKQRDETKALKEEVNALVRAGEAREAALLRDQQLMADWTAANEEDAAIWAAVETARQKGFEETGAAREAQYISDQERMDAWIEKQKEAHKAALETTANIANSASNVADSIGSLFDAAADKHTDYAEELQEQREEALEEGNDALAASLQKQIEAEQEAALKAFKINKALTITSATLSTIAATAKALEAGWPMALITVPAALAAGGAQIALAAQQEPPEFDDTPQVMRAPATGDRTNVSLKGNDLFAAAQTPQGLRDQVDRMDGGRRRETKADRMNALLAGRTMTHDLRLLMGRA